MTALSHHNDPALIERLRWQIGTRGIVEFSGDWQPLAGIYPAAHARSALTLLRRGERRAGVWACSGPRSPIAVPGPWWVNVNTPEEAGHLLGA